MPSVNNLYYKISLVDRVALKHIQKYDLKKKREQPTFVNEHPFDMSRYWGSNSGFHLNSTVRTRHLEADISHLHCAQN